MLDSCVWLCANSWICSAAESRGETLIFMSLNFGASFPLLLQKSERVQDPQLFMDARSFSLLAISLLRDFWSSERHCLDGWTARSLRHWWNLLVEEFRMTLWFSPMSAILLRVYFLLTFIRRNLMGFRKSSGWAFRTAEVGISSFKNIERVLFSGFSRNFISQLHSTSFRLKLKTSLFKAFWKKNP